MPLLTHLPLEPGCEDYSFIDQAFPDFEQGLESILADSIEKLELDASLDEPDAITSSLFSGFSTQLILFLIPLNCSLLLVSGLENYGTRLGPFLQLCLWLPRCQHFNWFATSLATLQPFHFCLLHHLITSPCILPIGRLIRVYQDFRLASVLLLLPLLTWSSSFLASELPSLILFPLPDSEQGVILVSEVHELLTKVHDILDNVVSKWDGNVAHILVHFLKSASRQCHEVWASQFPFLHSLKDVPPSEACLYGHMNWSLGMAQQQSTIGLSQVFPPKERWQNQGMDWVQFRCAKDAFSRV